MTGHGAAMEGFDRSLQSNVDIECSVCLASVMVNSHTSVKKFFATTGPIAEYAEPKEGSMKALQMLVALALSALFLGGNFDHGPELAPKEVIR